MLSVTSVRIGASASVRTLLTPCIAIALVFHDPASSFPLATASVLLTP